VVADPFGRMKIASKAKGMGVENEAPGLMIACGLAMRSFD
jgi:type IV pilus assembly protein PilM